MSFPALGNTSQLVLIAFKLSLVISARSGIWGRHPLSLTSIGAVLSVTEEFGVAHDVMGPI